jgi:hypothetical protein
MLLQWASAHLRSVPLLGSDVLSCPHPQLLSCQELSKDSSCFLPSRFWQKFKVHQSSATVDFTLLKTTGDVCGSKWLPTALLCYSIKLLTACSKYMTVPTKNKNKQKIWQHSIMSSMSSCCSVALSLEESYDFSLIKSLAPFEPHTMVTTLFCLALEFFIYSPFSFTDGKLLRSPDFVLSLFVQAAAPNKDLHKVCC